MAIDPSTAVGLLKGVGKSRAEALEKEGFATAADLLWFFPFRYEDRRHPIRIVDLGRHADQTVLIHGRVLSASAHVSPRKRVKIFEVALADDSGAFKIIWFNQPFLEKQIHRDDRLSIYGVPRLSSLGHLQMEGPDWEKIDDEEVEGSVVPIYSKVGALPPKVFRGIVRSALEALPLLTEPLPEAVRRGLGVGELAAALQELHAPAELTSAFLRYRSPAHLRVILQEFFAFQLALRVRRASEEKIRKGRRIEIGDELRDEVRRVLPFRLTGAQKRVLKEIADDLRSDKPMYRLLQGDVGSGKTIVALIAAMIMIRNGHQVALLAPTEILVEQHEQRIRQLLGGAVMVAKATGSMGAAARRVLQSGLESGAIQLVVGTHALLEERIRFKSLGLAIVDEQHRFGVQQRQALFAKGETPDILVMTATPIPRSLALAVYGELELSVIDELPPGRKVIRTEVRNSTQLEGVWRFMDGEIAAGAQAYVVFPLIEESQKLNAKALSNGFAAVESRLPGRRLAMLHGRMSGAEKEETMQRFKRGEVDVLVATTVIEVGIDIPNASMMVILDADRFGLSQLHQLRGRVGRGDRKSYCVLITDTAKDRLSVFAATQSGFDVAEHDLQTRGPGEFLGTRQSGMPRFRFGNILRDHELMEKARTSAIRYIEEEGLRGATALVRDLLGAGMLAADRD